VGNGGITLRFQAALARINRRGRYSQQLRTAIDIGNLCDGIRARPIVATAAERIRISRYQLPMMLFAAEARDSHAGIMSCIPFHQWFKD